MRILEAEADRQTAPKQITRRIVTTYSGIVRAYATVRFRIIPLRFLEEIAQYLPESGRVLDLGCGFGLFALFMAMRRPSLEVLGVDLNTSRIAIARRSATELGVRNVRFIDADLRKWRDDRPIDAVYALDVFHHLPVSAGNELLAHLYERLPPGGLMLLKDVDTQPRLRLYFTYLLDLLMAPRDPTSYRSVETWRACLGGIGFSPVYAHYMWDVLPYPHMLLICSKPLSSG